jgi:hypothetical protein
VNIKKISLAVAGALLVVGCASNQGIVKNAELKPDTDSIRPKPVSTVFHRPAGIMTITFSPDGNSVPELIPELIAKMKEGYDMVIASRYLGSAKSEDDDLLTGFGNWLFTRTVNLLHGGKYTDVMVIYRAYKKEIAYELGLDREDAHALSEKLFNTKISWEPLLSVRAAKAKLKVSEIPGDEPPRIGGERKLQIFRWGAAYYFQFIRELWFWRPIVK